MGVSMRRQDLTSQGSAALIDARYPVGGWWAQMVTVEYERARGLRAVHQKANGFSVSASKTVTASVAAVYAMAAAVNFRKGWFPPRKFKVTSVQEGKSVGGAWDDGSRVDMNFYVKPGGKAQIAVQAAGLQGAPIGLWPTLLLQSASLQKRCPCVIDPVRLHYAGRIGSEDNAR